MNFDYMDDRLGMVETASDTAWSVDDFGTLVQVPFVIGQWFFQSADR